MKDASRGRSGAWSIVSFLQIVHTTLSVPKADDEAVAWEFNSLGGITHGRTDNLPNMAFDSAQGLDASVKAAILAARSDWRKGLPRRGKPPPTSWARSA